MATASFTNEDDLKTVLAEDFSIDPEFRGCLADSTGESQNQSELEAANELREWAKPIPKTDYMAVRAAFFGEIWRA